MSKARLYTILLAPHVTEKTSLIADSNQYVFKVRKDATKTEIKEAVELCFDVKVASVRTLNTKSLTKRFGRRMGTTKAFKKAYVRLKEGSVIENLVEAV